MMKNLSTNDKENLKVAGFILLAFLAVTIYFRNYLLGFAFGPQVMTSEALSNLEKGGFYQNYVSIEADDFIETDQILVTQTTNRGRVIGEDYEGQFILVPLDESHYLAVNVRSQLKNGDQTYKGFLSDELQYSLPYWADNMSLKGEVLSFYLDDTKRPLWWVIVIWVGALVFCVILAKEQLTMLKKEELHSH